MRARRDRVPARSAEVRLRVARQSRIDGVHWRRIGRVAVPTVVIDVPPADRPAAHAQVLADSCTRSLASEGKCALAVEGSEEQAQAEAVAIVSWADDDRRVARIEVGLRKAARGEWRARTIEFRKEDAPVERWRAVGLVIATLVGETIRARVEAKASEPPQAAPPPGPKPLSPKREAPPQSPVRAPHDRLWLDVTALIGSGLDVAARRGAGLRVAWAPIDPPLYLALSGDYTATSRDAMTGIAGQWLRVGGGVGAFVAMAHDLLRFDARLELLANHLTVDVVDPTSGAMDTGNAWVATGRLSLEAGVRLAPFLGVVAGGEASVGQRTNVLVRGLETANDASNGAGLAAFVGLRAIMR
jgi:hypothetical protein